MYVSSIFQFFQLFFFLFIIFLHFSSVFIILTFFFNFLQIFFMFIHFPMVQPGRASFTVQTKPRFPLEKRRSSKTR